MDTDKLYELAHVLSLTQTEQEEMFDLVGKKRKEIAPDLTDYVLDRMEA